MMKKRPLSQANVSVFATTAGRAEDQYIVLVPPALSFTSVIVLSSHRFAAVPERNLIFDHFIIPLIVAVVVRDVVVPPVAVTVPDHLERAPHAPAPNVPASAIDGI